MDSARRKQLEAAGFRAVTIQEFCGLTDEDMALIDMKIRLVEMLKAARKAKGITQHKLAKLMSSSQSRVAKLEGECLDASLDLICRALFAVGITPRDIGKSLTGRKAA